jgi:UDP-N-acetylmuramoyl-tripeptide--D-alanyl-D-alanine ligase
MNHRGEIAALTAIAKPDIGVITNVGTAHIEFLVSQDEIALEKGDLVADLPPEATAVLNTDDSRVAEQAKRTRARVLRFGRSEDADVRALNVAAGDDGSIWFELSCAQGAREVAVAGLGEATLSNALAASAAALAAGATLDDVVAGLRQYRPVSGRLTRIDLPGDVVVIDDTYNANPQSMENALRTLAELPRMRHIAVLGAMGELGSTTDDAHLALGRLAAQLELHTVFAVGKGAAGIAAGALEKGMPPSSVVASDTCDEAIPKLIELLIDGDGVLVKGSRSARMERVVEALIEHKNPGGNL